MYFFSKSDHKIVIDGHFKILVIECTRGGAAIDPKLLVSSLHISVTSLLIFNMFNMYKNNISTMFLVLF